MFRLACDVLGWEVRNFDAWGRGGRQRVRWRGGLTSSSSFVVMLLKWVGRKVAFIGVKRVVVSWERCTRTELV